jgi:hypothetical protein
VFEPCEPVPDVFEPCEPKLFAPCEPVDVEPLEPVPIVFEPCEPKLFAPCEPVEVEPLEPVPIVVEPCEPIPDVAEPCETIGVAPFETAEPPDVFGGALVGVASFLVSVAALARLAAPSRLARISAAEANLMPLRSD